MKLFETKANKKKNVNNWIKCPHCQSAVYEAELVENLKICSKCGYYHRMNAYERVALLVDSNSFHIMDQHIYSLDPLLFGEEYMDKLMADVKATAMSDAIITGTAKIADIPVALGVMNFGFRGGSMGSVVGEKLVRLFETAAVKKLPAIVVSASGGARMQEGVIALMQMAKTTSAINRFCLKSLPYISILTDPTTGGVSASFAMLADIIIAESGAIVGFSGARVIEQTIRQKLPPGFQSSEYLLEHGFADKVVFRNEMRDTLIQILSYFQE